MKITVKDIYNWVGLDIGDKINIEGYESFNPFILMKESIQDKMNSDFSIQLLINRDFEKIESKIWDIKDIKEGDRFYFVDGEYGICSDRYTDYEKEIIETIAFKSHEYTEEYLEKLIEFNEKYKKECE